MIPKMNRMLLSLLLLSLFLAASASAAIVSGNIYNSKLELESNVLVEVDSQPQQKYLAKEGDYSFNLPPGTYTLTAKKEDLTASEKLEITKDGEYTVDLFLLPSLAEEDDLWTETQADYFSEDLLETDSLSKYYWIGGAALMLLLTAGGALLWNSRKKKTKEKSGPTDNELKEPSLGPVETETTEQANVPKYSLEEEEKASPEPGYLEKTLEIIKNNDGRIYQKDLRKELFSLSEAKVSLILTELEDRGKVKRIKKGRGNVIIIKE